MTLANWRDLAVVLLAIEAALMALVPGVVVYFMIRGMLWVIHRVRHYAPIIQGFFGRAERVSEKLSRSVARPIIGLYSGAAQVARWSHVRSSSPPSRGEV